MKIAAIGISDVFVSIWCGRRIREVVKDQEVFVIFLVGWQVVGGWWMWSGVQVESKSPN
jgi:hypothetical protein